ncbi:MAG: AraC family transcriptional regulator [Blastochloris sp.]|nr:AraC family transcriptional regulator [Blastochloris sp.]
MKRKDRSVAEAPSGVDSVYADEFIRTLPYSHQRPKGSGDYLLIYTQAGGGLIQWPGGSYTTGPGDVLIYHPGVYQHYQTCPRLGRWHLLWAHFQARPAWPLWLQWPGHRLGAGVLRLPENESRQKVVEALRRVIESCRRTEEMQRVLTQTCLEEVLLRIYLSRSPTREHQPRDLRMDRAVLLLEREFKQDFDLPSLARRCGLSVSHFCRLFVEQMSMTAQQFHEEQRLKHAAQILRLTTLKIGEVAQECGYEDPYYFSNRFKKRFGCSPLGYRQSGDNSAAH